MGSRLLDVVCPDGATAGDTIAVTTDTGASFDVVVPDGVGPGVGFHVELPAEPPASPPPARPTFEVKQDPREADALHRLQRFARRRHRRLQARRAQLAPLSLPDDERAPLLVPPTPAKNLLKRQERAALVIQSYARAGAVRRQAAELAAVSGVAAAAPKISINEESAAGWRAWLERAGRPDNAGDENGLPDDPFEPLRLQLALRLPHGGAALAGGGMVLGGFMEAAGDELCALLGLGREQLRVTRVSRGDPTVLHFELHAGMLRAAAVGVSPAQAALTLAQLVAGEAPGKRPPYAPPAVSPLAYTEWLCHADAAAGLRRSLADGAVVRVGQTGQTGPAAAAQLRLGHGLGASASSASTYHGRMARLGSAGAASAAGLSASGASARSLGSTTVGARGARGVGAGAGGRGAARRTPRGGVRRGSGGGGGGGASCGELGVADAALAWAAAGSEKARPPAERLLGGLALDGLASRSLALLEAVKRSAPGAPPWLREAVEVMEFGGGFDVDGDESGWRAARLPAPVWSLLSLGACGGLHRLRLAGIGLAALPDDVTRLSELQQLLLPGNTLSALPRLSSLPRLTSLDLSRNQLAALPEHVGGLAALRRLSVAHNLLAALPDALCGLERLERLDASHNALAVLPPHFGDAPRGLARLASLDLSANKLQSLPACLLRLEHCALRSLHLEHNPLPPAAMLFRARVRSGLYVAVEFCIAPRPSFSLKGDSTRYLRAFLEVRAAVGAVLGARVLVVPNPGAAETRQDVGDLDDAIEAAHYPRLGACEVVVRSQLGGFCTLHSKVATARFAQPAAVVAALLRHLGLPVHPEGYAEGDAEVARAELRAAAAAGDVPRVYAALAHSPHVAGPDAVRAAREAGHEAVVRMLVAAGAAG